VTKQKEDTATAADAAQIKQLRAELAANNSSSIEIITKQRAEINEQQKWRKEAEKEIADLKERLVTAESANQMMRGYIARVQEDDVVREELVAVGDPTGEQSLMPKRKPRMFTEPSPFMSSQGDEMATMSRYAHGYGERPRPKHWIRYGE
jgi:hypothetical protein